MEQFFKTRISIYKNYNCDFKTQIIKETEDVIYIIDLRGFDFEDIKISMN